jgi:hypothetical protein
MLVRRIYKHGRRNGLKCEPAFHVELFAELASR